MKLLDLGLNVSILRWSRNLLFKGLFSGILGRSRSHLGLKTEHLGLETQGLMYIPALKTRNLITKTCSKKDII